MKEKDPQGISNETISEIIKAIPLINTFLDGIEKEALRRINMGVPVPGVKVGNTRSSREWSIDSADVKDKLVQMGVPVFSVLEPVSPYKAEKLTWTDLDGSAMRLSQEQKQSLAQFVRKKDGVPKIMIDNVSAVGFFTNVTTGE